MEGEGMVAVVRGLRDSGLAVTLLDGNKQYTLMPTNSTAQPTCNHGQVTNAATQQSAPRITTNNSTDPNYVQCDRDAQVVDGRYASTYKTMHCNMQSTSPPEQLTEFPPQRPNHCPGQGHFQVGGLGSGSNYSPVRPSSPVGFRGGMIWPDRGSVCTPRLQSPQPDSFANSLRKYPHLSVDRSSEVMERLINYTQAKGYYPNNISRNSTRSHFSPTRLPDACPHYNMEAKNTYPKSPRYYPPETSQRSRRSEDYPTRDRKYEQESRYIRNFDVRHLKDMSKRARENVKNSSIYPYTHPFCPVIKEYQDYHPNYDMQNNSSNSVNMEIQAAVKMISKEAATVKNGGLSRKSVALPNSSNVSAGEDNVEGDCIFVPKLDTNTSFKIKQTSVPKCSSDETLHFKKCAQTVSSTIELNSKNRSKYMVGRKTKSQEQIKLSKDELKKRFLELTEEVSASNKSKKCIRDELVNKLFHTNCRDVHDKVNGRNSHNEKCNKYVSTLCPSGCDYVGDFKELVGKLKYCYGDTKQVLYTEVKQFRMSEHRQLDFVLKDWLNNLNLKTKEVGNYIDRVDVLSTVENKIKDLFKNRTKRDFSLTAGIVDIIQGIPIEVTRTYNKKVYLHKLVEVLLRRMRNVILSQQNAKIKRKVPVNILKKILTEEDLRDFVRGHLLDFFNQCRLDICVETFNEIENEIIDIIMDSIDCIRCGHIDEVSGDIKLVLQDLGKFSDKQANYIAGVILQDLLEMPNNCNFNQTFMILHSDVDNCNKKTANNDSGLHVIAITESKLDANVDQYTNQISQRINEWLDSLNIPPIPDRGFRDVVITDLAGDIIDRQKYLELNPHRKGSEQDELETLKYQIFKWINKLVGEDNMETIANAKSLKEMIDSLPVPMHTNKHPELETSYDPMRPCLKETGPSTCKEDNLKLIQSRKKKSCCLNITADACCGGQSCIDMIKENQDQTKQCINVGTGPATPPARQGAQNYCSIPPGQFPSRAQGSCPGTNECLNGYISPEMYEPVFQNVQGMPYNQHYGTSQPTYGPGFPVIQGGPGAMGYDPTGPGQQWNGPDAFPPLQSYPPMQTYPPRQTCQPWFPCQPTPPYRPKFACQPRQGYPLRQGNRPRQGCPLRQNGPAGMTDQWQINPRPFDSHQQAVITCPGPKVNGQVAYPGSSGYPSSQMTDPLKEGNTPVPIPIGQLTKNYDIYLKEWVKEIPIKATTPTEQQEAEKARKDMYNGVWKAITKMKLDHNVFNDPYHYQDVFDEEIEQLFKQVPKSEELEEQKPALKAQLLEKTVAMNEQIKSSNVPASFKHQLIQNIENNLPRHTHPDDHTQQIEEVQKIDLAESYILYSKYKEEDSFKADFHKRNFIKKLEETLDTVKKAQNSDLNVNKYANEIINSLDKVPIPNQQAIRSEADDILLGMEVERWISDIPLNSDNTGPLEKRRFRDAIVKKIQDLGMNENYNDDSFAGLLENELPRHLEKLPIQEGTNIEFLISELANRIKNLVNSNNPQKSVSFQNATLGYGQFVKDIPASSSLTEQGVPFTTAGYDVRRDNITPNNWFNQSGSPEEQWHSMQQTVAPPDLQNSTMGPHYQSQPNSQNIPGHITEFSSNGTIVQSIPVSKCGPGKCKKQGISLTSKGSYCTNDSCTYKPHSADQSPKIGTPQEFHDRHTIDQEPAAVSQGQVSPKNQDGSIPMDHMSSPGTPPEGTQGQNISNIQGSPIRHQGGQGIPSVQGTSYSQKSPGWSTPMSYNEDTQPDMTVNQKPLKHVSHGMDGLDNVIPYNQDVPGPYNQANLMPNSHAAEESYDQGNVLPYHQASPKLYGRGNLTPYNQTEEKRDGQGNVMPHDLSTEQMPYSQNAPGPHTLRNVTHPNQTTEEMLYKQNSPRPYGQSGIMPYIESDKGMPYNQDSPRPYAKTKLMPYNQTGDETPHSRDFSRPYGQGKDMPYNQAGEEIPYGQDSTRPYGQSNVKPYNQTGEEMPYSQDSPRTYGQGNVRPYNQTGEEMLYSQDSPRTYGQGNVSPYYQTGEEISLSQDSSRPYGQSRVMPYSKTGEEMPYNQIAPGRHGQGHFMPYNQTGEKIPYNQVSSRPYGRGRVVPYNQFGEEIPYSQDSPRPHGQGNVMPYNKTGEEMPFDQITPGPYGKGNVMPYNQTGEEIPYNQESSRPYGHSSIRPYNETGEEMPHNQDFSRPYRQGNVMPYKQTGEDMPYTQDSTQPYGQDNMMPYNQATPGHQGSPEPCDCRKVINDQGVPRSYGSGRSMPYKQDSQGPSSQGTRSPYSQSPQRPIDQGSLNPNNQSPQGRKGQGSATLHDRGKSFEPAFGQNLENDSAFRPDLRGPHGTQVPYSPDGKDFQGGQAFYRPGVNDSYGGESLGKNQYKQAPDDRQAGPTIFHPKRDQIDQYHQRPHGQVSPNRQGVLAPRGKLESQPASHEQALTRGYLENNRYKQAPDDRQAGPSTYHPKRDQTDQYHQGAYGQGSPNRQGVLAPGGKIKSQPASHEQDSTRGHSFLDDDITARQDSHQVQSGVPSQKQHQTAQSFGPISAASQASDSRADPMQNKEVQEMAGGVAGGVGTSQQPGRSPVRRYMANQPSLYTGPEAHISGFNPSYTSGSNPSPTSRFKPSPTSGSQPSPVSGPQSFPSVAKPDGAQPDFNDYRDHNYLTRNQNKQPDDLFPHGYCIPSSCIALPPCYFHSQLRNQGSHYQATRKDHDSRYGAEGAQSLPDTDDTDNSTEIEFERCRCLRRARRCKARPPENQLSHYDHRTVSQEATIEERKRTLTRPFDIEKKEIFKMKSVEAALSSIDIKTTKFKYCEMRSKSQEELTKVTKTHEFIKRKDLGTGDPTEWFEIQSDNLKVKLWGDKMQKLVEKLRKPGGEEKLRLQIEKYLKKVPNQFPEGDDEGLEFRKQLPNNIIKKLKKMCKIPITTNVSVYRMELPQYGSRFKTENFRKIVKDWVKTLNLKKKDFLGRTVKREDVFNFVTDKLEPLVLNRPVSDLEYKARLNKNVVDIIDDLPLFYSNNNKEIYIKKITEILVNDIFNSEKNLSHQYIQPTNKEVKEFVKDEITFFLEKARVAMSTKRMEYLETELIDVLLDLKHVADIDNEVEEDIINIFKDIVKLPVYKAKYFTNLLLRDYKEFFFRESFFREKVKADHARPAVYSVLQNVNEEVEFDTTTTFEVYTQQLIEEIGKWLSKIDIPNKDNDFVKMIIKDLASDIADRQKYLIFNTGTKCTETEEFEQLKYQIFKWTNKLVGDENKTVLDRAPELMKILNSIPKPTFKRKSHNDHTMQRQNSDKEYDRPFNDRLTEEIYDWFLDLPIELYVSQDTNFNKQLIRDLAEVIQKNHNNKDDKVMDIEFGKWCDKVFNKRLSKCHLEQLKNKVRSLLFEEEQSGKNPKYEKTLIRFYEDIVDEWIDTVPIEPDKKTIFLKNRNEYIHELGVKIYKLKSRYSHLPTEEVDRKLQEEISSWLNKLPLHQILDKRNSRDEYANRLLKNTQTYSLNSVKSQNGKSTADSLKVAVLEWVKKLPCYKIISVQIKSYQEAIMTNLANKLFDAINDKQSDPDRIIIEHIRLLDAKQNDDNVLKTALQLKLYLQEHNIVLDTQRQNSVEDIFVRNINSWLNNLPLDISDVSHYNNQKSHFIECMKRLKSSNSDNAVMKEEIVTLMKLFPMDSSKKGDKRYLEEEASKLILALTLVPIGHATRKPPQNDGVSEAIKKWANKLPLKYVHNLKELLSFIDDMSSVITTLLLHPEYSNKEENDLKLRREIVKFLKRFPFEHEFCTERHILKMADELQKTLNDLHLHQDNDRINNVAVYGVSLNKNNTNLTINKQESDSPANYKDYTKKLVEQIGEWFDELHLPTVEKETYKDVVINDLAGDIIDRRKFLELNSTGTEESELEHLKYQIFKLMSKLVGEANTVTFDQVVDLMKRIQKIPAPLLVMPQDKNQSVSQNYFQKYGSEPVSPKMEAGTWQLIDSILTIGSPTDELSVNDPPSPPPTTTPRTSSPGPAYRENNHNAEAAVKRKSITYEKNNDSPADTAKSSTLHITPQHKDSPTSAATIPQRISITYEQINNSPEISTKTFTSTDLIDSFAAAKTTYQQTGSPVSADTITPKRSVTNNSTTVAPPTTFIFATPQHTNNLSNFSNTPKLTSTATPQQTSAYNPASNPSPTSTSRLQSADKHAKFHTWDSPPPPPQESTKEAIYDKYQKIFKDKCNALPVDTSTPSSTELADLARTGMYNGIVKTFFKLKSDPEIENDYGYFEFMLEDKIDEMLDILPQTKEFVDQRHAWKIDILRNAIDMLDQLHGLSDRPSFRQRVRNKFNRNFARDLEIEECFLLQQGFLAEMADAYLLETNYKEKNPIKANAYKNRLMNKIEELTNHLSKEHNVGFRFFKKAQLARIAMKVLEQVPIPDDNTMQDEAEEIQIADEIAKWYAELPTKPFVNQTDGVLRKRMIDLLAKKLHDIKKRINDHDPSKEQQMKHEISQFLEKRGKLQQDQDLNINFMVDQLNTRLKNRIHEPTNYEAFNGEKPFSSTFAKVDNIDFFAPLMDAATSTDNNPMQDYHDYSSHSGQPTTNPGCVSRQGFCPMSQQNKLRQSLPQGRCMPAGRYGPYTGGTHMGQIPQNNGRLMRSSQGIPNSRMQNINQSLGEHFVVSPNGHFYNPNVPYMVPGPMPFLPSYPTSGHLTNIPECICLRDDQGAHSTARIRSEASAEDGETADNAYQFRCRCLEVYRKRRRCSECDEPCLRLRPYSSY